MIQNKVLRSIRDFQTTKVASYKKKTNHLSVESFKLFKMKKSHAHINKQFSWKNMIIQSKLVIFVVCAAFIYIFSLLVLINEN